MEDWKVTWPAAENGHRERRDLASFATMMAKGGGSRLLRVVNGRYVSQHGDYRVAGGGPVAAVRC